MGLGGRTDEWDERGGHVRLSVGSEGIRVSKGLKMETVSNARTTHKNASIRGGHIINYHMFSK